MDSIIKQYSFAMFDELCWCKTEGIMYQNDMTQSVDYGVAYYERYVTLKASEIANKLNLCRTSITQKYCKSILDIGIGSGEFIKSSKLKTYGFDINPIAITWLESQGLFKNPYESMPEVDGLSFWDSLEHIPNPNALLSLMRSGQYAFIALPIFEDLEKVKQSKHYKPNEHYYYFSKDGMIKYMQDSNFTLIEITDDESQAGRDGILTFVFLKT